MFGQLTILRGSQQSFHKFASQSTMYSETDNEKLSQDDISEFSLDLPQECHLLTKSSEKSVKTSCQDETYSMEQTNTSFDSKTQNCSLFFSKMTCSYGQDCMFSHTQTKIVTQTSRNSLFDLLSQYPQLAILKGSRRQCSLFF